MTWHEAMERFGTDKPDIRFGMELVDLGEVFADTEFRAFQADAVKGICVPGMGDVSRSTVDNLVDRAKLLGAAGLVWMRVKEGGALEAPILKFLGREGAARHRRDARGGARVTCVLIVAGERRMTNHVLGILRLDLGRPPVNEGGLQLLWVLDFPLFEALDGDGRPIPAHHPFTMPHPEDLDLLDSVVGRRPARGALAGLRPRPERLGARLGQRANPLAGRAAEDLLVPRHRARGGAGALRVPARRVPVRRAAARRVRVRRRPPRRACSPARRTSARSSRSRRRRRARTR